MIFVDGVYHADPHPGNIFVAADGAIVFVDFGAVGVLAPHMRQGIPAFFEGVIRRDPRGSRMPSARWASSRAIPDRATSRPASSSIFSASCSTSCRKSRSASALCRSICGRSSRRSPICGGSTYHSANSPRRFRFQKIGYCWSARSLLLLGLCTELDPSWNPMTVIRPYLEDVVLGQDRDWGSAAALRRLRHGAERRHDSG